MLSVSSGIVAKLTNHYTKTLCLIQDFFVRLSSYHCSKMLSTNTMKANFRFFLFVYYNGKWDLLLLHVKDNNNSGRTGCTLCPAVMYSCLITLIVVEINH